LLPGGKIIQDFFQTIFVNCSSRIPTSDRANGFLIYLPEKAAIEKEGQNNYNQRAQNGELPAAVRIKSETFFPKIIFFFKKFYI